MEAAALAWAALCTADSHRHPPGLRTVSHGLRLRLIPQPLPSRSLLPPPALLEQVAPEGPQEEFGILLGGHLLEWPTLQRAAGQSQHGLLS